MRESKSEKARKLIKAHGRRVWDRNPTTRVVPNKKKAKPLRKEKHKGRQYAGPWHFQGLHQSFKIMSFRSRSPAVA
ncbi:MAG: hypothetical protein QNK37_05405 [Acidobacteriota bacterium]|nr:hypothetical protein [Acidobacteriota bacterium]